MILFLSLRAARRGAWLLLLEFLLACATASMVSAQAGGWTIECVDCPRMVSGMTDHALRIDAAGHLHAAYGGDHLYYAWHDDVVWHVETADNRPGVGAYASLAFDPAGRPHISYYAGVHDCLSYAYRDETGWHVDEYVDCDAGKHTSLAVDAQGYPHIAYDDGYLGYAYRDADGWHWEELGLGGYNKIEDISLALDAAGEPHIAVSLEDYTQPSYAFHDAAGWHYEWTVPGQEGVDDVSLVLGTGDYPHIAYGRRQSGSVVNYSYQAADGWHTEVADSGTGLGAYPSLYLDDAGLPHITYQGPGQAGTRYAVRDGDGWHVSDVDSEGGRSSVVAMAESNAQVLYTGGGSGELRYAVNGAAGWQVTVMHAVGSAGEDPSLALGTDGSVHLAYVQTIGTENLVYTWYDATGWQREVVPTSAEEILVGGTALALDAMGKPHIVYSAYQKVGYAHRDATGWHMETVEAVLNAHPSLAFDHNDRPHLTYYGTGGIRYAYKDGTGWHVQTVDPNGGSSSSYLSLDIDGQGRVHLSYHSSSNYSPWIAYARLDTTGWYTERVDTSSFFASVAVDTEDVPRLAYYRSAHYAKPGASGWLTETVDQRPGVFEYTGYYISLALDGADNPHLAYIDHNVYYSNSIQYAARTPDGWQTESVWSGPEWINRSSLSPWLIDYLSLAVTPAGDAYIAFYDPWSKDLKLAYKPAPSPRVYLPLVVRGGQ